MKKALMCLGVLVSLVLVFEVSAGTNYIMNPGGEEGWTSNAFMLSYTGGATTATFWVDESTKHFMTFLDGVVDANIDLSNWYSYEYRQAVSDALVAKGYTVTDLGWAGDPAINWYANAEMITSQSIAPYPGENILNNPYPVQARHCNAWGGYQLSGTNSSPFARSGKYAISVYDDRPSPWLAGSPESVSVSQQLHVSNPNWAELKGKTVKLSGWLSTPAGALHTEVGDSGGCVRVHHGVGGAAIEDVSVWTGTSNFGWNYFERVFTIDPASDGITVVLFANANPNNVYWGCGHTLFDDLALEVSGFAVTCQVTLLDYSQNYVDSAIAVRYDVSSGTTSVASGKAILDNSGAFTIPDVPPGSYTLTVKAYAHRQKSVSITVSGVTNVSVDLTGGDNDGDNAVTSSDLAIVLANME